MRGPGRRTLDWVRGATDRGAGEVVLNCMRRDGMREGYDLEHISAVIAATTVPVIASGGEGGREHFRDVFREAGGSGALAASIFAYGRGAITEPKEYPSTFGIEEIGKATIREKMCSAVMILGVTVL